MKSNISLKLLIGIVLICSLFLLHNTGMSSTDVKPNPNPVPTPYQPPAQGGSPNAPVGQQGYSYPSNFIGPIFNPVGSYSGGVTNPQNVSTTTSTNSTQNFPSGLTGGTSGGGGGGGGGSSVPPNPYTTYIDGKKLFDLMGEGSRDQWGNPIGGKPATSYTSPEGQTFGSFDEYNRLINEAFGSSMGYLNQNEQMLGTSKSAAEQAAQADFLANQGVLGTNREQTLGQLGTQARGVQTQKEDALAQARRLFNELQRGNIQRFGGATSAGQAASEIQGAEAQRQFGQTGRQANEAFQKIEQAKTEVESQYKTGLLQLQQAHQQGLAKIQSDFTNAIMQINNQRAATEQAKGQAKLQALQNLRQEALQLQSQATQFQQQLDLMREQANLNIQQYAKTVGTAASTGASAMNTFGTQSQQTPSFSQVQSLVGQNLGNQYVGSIRKPEEWQYQGAIKKSVVGKLSDGRALYSDGTAGWSY